MGMCCAWPCSGLVASTSLVRMAFEVLVTAMRRRRRVAGPQIAPTDAMMKLVVALSREMRQGFVVTVEEPKSTLRGVDGVLYPPAMTVATQATTGGTGCTATSPQCYRSKLASSHRCGDALVLFLATAKCPAPPCRRISTSTEKFLECFPSFSTSQHHHSWTRAPRRASAHSLPSPLMEVFLPLGKKARLYAYQLPSMMINFNEQSNSYQPMVTLAKSSFTLSNLQP